MKNKNNYNIGGEEVDNMTKDLAHLVYMSIEVANRNGDCSVIKTLLRLVELKLALQQAFYVNDCQDEAQEAYKELMIFIYGSDWDSNPEADAMNDIIAADSIEIQNNLNGGKTKSYENQ